MTQKEKARRYDEALEKARDVYTYYCDDREQLRKIESIFPELKESEDEMIRKELITQCRNTRCVTEEGAERVAKWIAWLEKQVEVKESLISQHENKKCKENDDSLTSEDEKIRKALIDYFDDANKADENPLQSYGVHTDKVIAWLEKQGEESRRQRVEDAMREIDEKSKDFVEAFQGKTSEEILAEMRGEQKLTDKVKPKFHEGEWLCENEPNNYARFIQILEIVNVQGKERYRVSRDIHNDEDIVEFNFVEKYYHKFDVTDAKDGDVLAFKDGTSGILIYKESTENFGVLSYCRVIRNSFIDKEESGWGSTLLSPATKEQRDTLMKAMTDAGFAFDFEKKELKKIEKNPAWSEECKEAFSDICENCCGRTVELVKKIMQPKQEWSEEDEDKIVLIEKAIYSLVNDGITFTDATRLCDWLKSLRPQNTWKPSDEQLDALDSTLQYSQVSHNSFEQLNSLFNDLKKLREE